MTATSASPPPHAGALNPTKAVSCRFRIEAGKTGSKLCALGLLSDESMRTRVADDMLTYRASP